jgi:hypothetical protein
MGKRTEGEETRARPHLTHRADVRAQIPVAAEQVPERILTLLVRPPHLQREHRAKEGYQWGFIGVASDWHSGGMGGCIGVSHGGVGVA